MSLFRSDEKNQGGRIGRLEKRIDALDAAGGAGQQTVNATTAKGASRLSTAYEDETDKILWKLLHLNEIITARGGFIVNPEPDAYSMIVGKTAQYELYLNIQAEYHQKDIMEVHIYVNGVPIPEGSWALEGAGSEDPAILSWFTTHGFIKDDIVQIYFRNAEGGSGNITVNFKHISFGLKEDI